MKNAKSKSPITSGTNLQTNFKEKQKMNKLEEVENLIQQGYDELSAWYLVYGDVEGDWTNPDETDNAL